MTLFGIEISALVFTALIIAIICIGLMEWIKNFLKPENKACYAILNLLLLIPCALINTSLVPASITIILDVLLLGLAFTQIGYQSIIQGIPSLINSLIGKVADK